jgi:putative ABC transport system ATP-binding protein
MSNTNQDVHVVDVKAVTKTFRTAAGGFTALHEVDLTIRQGEFVALVGKSGSGKSTLLNLVSGIDRPTAGRIVVAGTAIAELGEDRLASWRGRNVGVVFQFFQLLPTLTVLENVVLPMDFCHTLPLSKARHRGLELLDQVGIVDQANKLPAALSGGQQQRAAIARALANDPSLLVADEPTGNLDTQTAEDVLSLLARQRKGGTSILMVTHERDVSRLVDRVVTLSDGRIVGERKTQGAAHA